MRHIGVAVGDTETRMAHALGAVGSRRSGSNAARMAGIEPFVREWRPARLVVGLPLALDGAEHEMTARARRFARQLTARFGVPVDLADERLSSVAAEEGLVWEGWELALFPQAPPRPTDWRNRFQAAPLRPAGAPLPGDRK